MTDLESLRERVRTAELAAANAPGDPQGLRKLADDVAGVAFDCGFYQELSDEYSSLYDSAIAMYREAVAVQPDDGVLLNNLGAALSDRGHHSSAVDVLRQAIAQIPEDCNVHFNLAVALMNTNSAGQSEARKHFATAAKLERGAETREAFFDPHGY